MGSGELYICVQVAPPSVVLKMPWLLATNPVWSVANETATSGPMCCDRGSVAGIVGPPGLTEGVVVFPFSGVPDDEPPGLVFCGGAVVLFATEAGAMPFVMLSRILLPDSGWDAGFDVFPPADVVVGIEVTGCVGAPHPATSKVIAIPVRTADGGLIFSTPLTGTDGASPCVVTFRAETHDYFVFPIVCCTKIMLWEL